MLSQRHQRSMADTRALGDFLAALPRTHDRITTVMDTALLELGLTWARWRVLRLLADEALPVPHIARMLGLTRQAVQRIVNDLLQNGAVARGPNPHHQRAALIRLSQKGRELVGEATRRENAVLQRIGKGIGDEHVKTANQLLVNLHARVGRIDIEALIEGQIA
jgi:DNA-binding MarR family transcriptional regulator